MTIPEGCLFLSMLLPAGLLPALSARKPGPVQEKRQSYAASQNAPAQDRGEQVFAANCSRCHNPPMTLSPRISGTVLMHMRVRARLSREDEAALLRYMAPQF